MRIAGGENVKLFDVARVALVESREDRQASRICAAGILETFRLAQSRGEIVVGIWGMQSSRDDHAKTSTSFDQSFCSAEQKA
ncbi:uncharacterized protein LOC112343884 isoform X2 [Selaginella moellendorffii]|uniref:uncharacterized protein LOC112342006 isoform X2 n=1 Tax=Selaginella moellendorffii TaxID=88036 RepID=UPI000D1C210F|nr:uncharacterized protein LOC112342006 isoform X2 [Selaginella moellendorffii]XP_024518864.1 uncharacterized protein LOC112342007 isoform X2 [Selaginella moellendorffii]XP_024518867.1 uncharacterized protein LOC112342008 isoform X2 [Selaginella moellendorffii]XP_024523738.1 uncharacterized protein LOC112343884 isoform X2 [Selaginella moellendorffii]|eukprot:XP_024518860.1 uncharacterized protein LOC112342006 isoform X2 [Selaginella moellendorffii]